MPKLDIHRVQQRLEAYLRIVDKLPQRNKELILGFKRECETRGLSGNRILFYVHKICITAKKVNKDLDKLTKEEIKGVIADIENNDSYKEWTKSGYKISIKKFYQFIDGYDWNSKKFPDRVEWIRTGTEVKIGGPCNSDQGRGNKTVQCCQGRKGKGSGFLHV